MTKWRREHDALLRERGQALMREATLLSPGPSATALVDAALVRVFSRPLAVTPGTDAETAVRVEMARLAARDRTDDDVESALAAPGGAAGRFAALTGATRAAVVLRFRLERPVDEVATLLRMRPDEVRARLDAATRALAGYVDPAADAIDVTAIDVLPGARR